MPQSFWEWALWVVSYVVCWGMMYAIGCMNNDRKIDGVGDVFRRIREDVLLHCPWSRTVSVHYRAQELLKEIDEYCDHALYHGKKFAWDLGALRRDPQYLHACTHDVFVSRTRFWVIWWLHFAGWPVLLGVSLVGMCLLIPVILISGLLGLIGPR